MFTHSPLPAPFWYQPASRPASSPDSQTARQPTNPPVSQSASKPAAFFPLRRRPPQQRSFALPSTYHSGSKIRKEKETTPDIILARFLRNQHHRAFRRQHLRNIILAISTSSNAILATWKRSAGGTLFENDEIFKRHLTRHQSVASR